MITISPSNPNWDNEVNLTFASAGCPDSVVENISGNVFTLSVEFSPGCDFSPPPYFEHTWNVGRLASGDYSVTFRSGVTGQGFNQEEQASFTVSEGVLPFPNPVPTMPTLSISILVVTLLLLVRLAKRK
jgi:hypothetical protein